MTETAWSQAGKDLAGAAAEMNRNAMMRFVVVDAVEQALRFCIWLHEQITALVEPSTQGGDRYTKYGNEITRLVQDLLQDEVDERVTDVARQLTREMINISYDAIPLMFPTVASEEYGSYWSKRQERSRIVLDRLQSLEEMLQALRVSKQETDLARAEVQIEVHRRREAEEVAATSGDKALSGYFGQLETEEAEGAEKWTTAAIATTAVGVLAGVAAHFSLGGQDELARVLYSALLTASFGGLAAYLARLGGHRRHTAQWAKSIKVQLDSYEKFIRHTDEGARAPIFDRFAARVLGDPPARNAKGDQTGLSLAEVLALMSKSNTP